MPYGTLDDDFSKHENLAGRETRGFAFSGKRLWFLRDDRFDDGTLVTSPVGAYQPNAWGLHDMVGNASEWTGSGYVPYPYRETAATGEPVDGPAVVRGGSWHDPPRFATPGYRRKYPAWRRVHNVGFRIVVPATQSE
jgi:formylglycine-generating enzyme required for sulfatase activity